MLNQYLMAEWVTTMMDLDLGDCVKYSLAGGTGRSRDRLGSARPASAAPTS